MIFGQQFAWTNANFACALDRVVARRSAAVWWRRVEKYGVGSLLRLHRASWKPVMVELLLWLLWLCVVVVRAFVVLFLRSSYDIF